jgi:hypothetical protein
VGITKIVDRQATNPQPTTINRSEEPNVQPKRLIPLAIASLLGTVTGNLIVHLIQAYHQAQQVKERALAGTEVIGVRWVPQSTLAATMLASQTTQRSKSVAFLLALAMTLVVVPASQRVHAST